MPVNFFSMMPQNNSYQTFPVISISPQGYFQDYCHLIWQQHLLPLTTSSLNTLLLVFVLSSISHTVISHSPTPPWAMPFSFPLWVYSAVSGQCMLDFLKCYFIFCFIFSLAVPAILFPGLESAFSTNLFTSSLNT